MKALAIGLLILALAACASPVGSPVGSPVASPVGGSTQRTNGPPDGTFPSAVAGLPVISVAHAVDLLGSGRLDGQAVAVAGYFNQFFPPCPMPGQYVGPLESWCRIVAFTDTRAGAQLCQSDGTNVTRCGAPSGVNLAPFFMSETSGDTSTWADSGQPVALVVIGHAGDARQWLCPASTQAQCASAFVVDRIAWANGQEVPVTAPQTGDAPSGKPLTPRMSLAEVAAATGVGDALLTGAAFRAGDIATVDPRWALAGDKLVWLVRSLAAAAGSGPAETRPESVWLVDDASGTVLDSQLLKLAADYQPARVWQLATVQGASCCSTDVAAFYRVQAADGTVVSEGLVPGGSSGGQGATTYGGGYGSGPIVLPAGRYTITAWLATDEGGVMGTPRDTCSTQVTLRALDNVTLNAAYPGTGACTLAPVPPPSSGP